MKAARAHWEALLVLIVALLVSACKAQAEPLPDLGRVQDFALTDQNARPVSLATFAGKPWVAAFMFTRCPSICPRITAAMKGLQAAARERELQFSLVSFSVDSSFDTPEVLREYAQKSGADSANWSFLSGDSKVVGQAANDSFKLALEGQADPSREHFGITHGSHLALVDGAGTIRGFYRSSEDAEMTRLLGDLERLQPR